jgi:hypothetical protein
MGGHSSDPIAPDGESLPGRGRRGAPRAPTARPDSNLRLGSNPASLERVRIRAMAEGRPIQPLRPGSRSTGSAEPNRHTIATPLAPAGTVHGSGAIRGGSSNTQAVPVCLLGRADAGRMDCGVTSLVRWLRRPSVCPPAPGLLRTTPPSSPLLDALLATSAPHHRGRGRLASSPPLRLTHRYSTWIDPLGTPEASRPAASRSGCPHRPATGAPLCQEIRPCECAAAADQH